MMEENKYKIDNVDEITQGSVEQLIDGYKISFNKNRVIDIGNIDKFFDVCNCIIPENIRANDILLFSSRLKEYQDDSDFRVRAGMYLSSLITNCDENLVSVCTKDLEKNIHLIGYRNHGKIISIDGNVGHGSGTLMDNGILSIRGDSGLYTGDQLCGGEIYVYGRSGDGFGRGMIGGKMVSYGDLGDFVGIEMEGGDIFVYGPVGDGLCTGMTGGKVHVYRDAGEYTCNGMTGGDVYIWGDIGQMSDDILGGNVFHKGNKILVDGEKVSIN